MLQVIFPKNSLKFYKYIFLFSSEFSLNDELYKITDYVVFKEGKHTKIGQLMCMFMDETCTFHIALKVEGMNKKVTVLMPNSNNTFILINQQKSYQTIRYLIFYCFIYRVS